MGSRQTVESMGSEKSTRFFGMCQTIAWRQRRYLSWTRRVSRREWRRTQYTDAVTCVVHLFSKSRQQKLHPLVMLLNVMWTNESSNSCFIKTSTIWVIPWDFLALWASGMTWVLLTVWLLQVYHFYVLFFFVAKFNEFNIAVMDSLRTERKRKMESDAGWDSNIPKPFNLIYQGN